MTGLFEPAIIKKQNDSRLKDMNEKHKEILEQIIKEMLLVMDFVGRVEIDGSRPEFLVVKITSDEASLLIGRGGDNLASFQHLARAVINKKLGAEAPIFIIDVNNYRASRLDFLKEMAINWAKQAVMEKQAKILDPMSPYERRVVHLALKDFSGVITESFGEGSQRRIVIKPL